MWVSGRSFSLIHGLGLESKGELLVSIWQSGMLELNRIERGSFSHWRAVMLCVTGMTMPKSNPDKDFCVWKQLGKSSEKALLCFDDNMIILCTLCCNFHSSLSICFCSSILCICGLYNEMLLPKSNNVIVILKYCYTVVWCDIVHTLVSTLWYQSVAMPDHGQGQGHKWCVCVCVPSWHY